MATNIIVNPTELESDAGIISGINDDLTAQLEEFKVKVTSLSEVWKSRASERTMEAINSLAPHFEEYRATIAQYVDTMKQIATEYSEKEGMNAQSADTTADFI